MDATDSGITTALLDPLYEAAAQPEMWKVFLQRASEVLRVDKAAILVHTPGNLQTTVCFDLGVTAEGRRDTEELTKQSPWMVEIQKHRKTGWYSGSPEDAMSMEKFRQTAFYNELFRKHNIEWAAATVVFGADGSMPSFAISRPKSGAPFSADERSLLRQLVPHLGRVFKIHQKVSSIRDRNAAGRYALDLIGAACVTLDEMGRILSMNRLAEGLIAGGATLRVKDRRLLAAVTVEQNALDACVVGACACGAGKSPAPGVGAVALHSGLGVPLYISVLPYHSNWSLFEGRPAALLFLTTPEEQGHGEHRLWQTLFGLSPAECRVAEMMKLGMEVAEISEAIKIKVDTVRYYQKSVYRKTGVPGQGQLMRLLTRLPSSST